MAVRPDVSVDWRVSPRIITVAAPSTTISIQDIVDTLRGIEDDSEVLIYPHLFDASGKNDLGGGSFVGITLALQNAELAFEARLGPQFELCTVNGGNLVAVDVAQTPIDPIHPTDFVTVVITQSSSPTIINADAAALWQAPLEGAVTAQELMNIIAAALAGKLSGAAGTSIAIRDVNDTKDRILATVDADGNRTAVTADGS